MRGTRCPGRACRPAGRLPAFGDARVRDLLRKAGACGLKPEIGRRAAPVLLELIGARIPVSQWPAQMTKAQRTEHAREAAQGAGRPGRQAAGRARRRRQATDGRGKRDPAAQRARLGAAGPQTGDSLDAERRRRREAAVPVTPKPPPRLGASFRERNVFVLPEDDEEPEG